MFNTDKPIKDSYDDMLGRSKFAFQLANSIMQFDTKDNYAISLQGKWGCGKTSVLNMTIEEINKLNLISNNRKIEVIQFNPWNFTDSNQLLNQFFLTMSNSLKVSNTEKDLKSIGELIEKYSSALEYTEYIPGIGQYLKFLPQLSKAFGKSVKENAKIKLNDVMYRKQQVELALNKLDERILVIIDDIDRLSNNQIKMIFQLVNSVAGFPNMTYLLSFDKEIVSRALSDVQNCNGDDYLEKIIQLPFEVPPINTTKLKDILQKRISQIIDINEDMNFNLSRWYKVFNTCILPLITNLRDVHRYCNVLTFSYSAVKDEINKIDMAAICAIKVFTPSIYEWIRNNKFSIVGGYDGNGVKKNNVKEFEAKILKEFDKVYPGKSRIMLDVISSLFPKFSNRVSYSVNFDSTSELHQKMRIASDNKFDLYFSLSLDCIKISQRELNDSLHMMDENKLREFILSLNDRNLIGDYLQEVKYNLSRIPEERIELLLSVLLFDKGRILEENSFLIGVNTIKVSIYMVRDMILKISDEELRFKVIQNIILKSDPSAFQYFSHLLHIIELTHGRIAHTDNIYNAKLVSLENLYKLENEFTRRVKYFTTKYNLFDWDEFRRINMLWEFIDKESYMSYMNTALDDDINMVKFLSIQLATWKSGNYITSYELNEQKYKNFISEDELNDLIVRVRNNKEFWSLDDRVVHSLVAFEMLLENSTQKEIGIKEISERFESWKKIS